jgi:3-oxoacyl-[acyl-carrier protein] reductase
MPPLSSSKAIWLFMKSGADLSDDEESILKPTFAEIGQTEPENIPMHVADLNRLLMKLSRILIPITYTAAGRFDHDPAWGQPHLPSLAGAHRLPLLEPESDEYHFLQTRLIRNRNQVDFALRQALEAIDATSFALVNNAGGVLGQVGRPLEEVTPGQWQAIYDVNVTGAFWFAQAVAPRMKRTGWGRIINISSGAGLGISLTGIQAYASAKAAQIGLTRQLAHELGPYGITVNNIAPGFVRSNPNSEKQWQAYGEEGQARLVDGIAMRRLGQPDDIAHGVIFFASEYAGWVTGQVLSIDGGR